MRRQFEKDSVFVLGCPRSGTTILTRQLTHSRDAYFFTKEDVYRRLRPGRFLLESLRRKLGLASDLAGDKEHYGAEEYWYWKVRDGRRVRRLDAAMRGRVFVNKRIDNIQILGSIREQFPRALFIQIVRDPRYVVASLLSKKRRALEKGAIFVPNRLRMEAGQLPELACEAWNYYNHEIERHLRKDDLVVRYEDYVREPSQFHRRVEEAVGIRLREKSDEIRNMNVTMVEDRGMVEDRCRDLMLRYRYLERSS